MTVFEIEIIHDFVCAWCYIGKRNLDRAISLHQKVTPGGRSDIFNYTWRSYYLNYNPHSRSVPKVDLVDSRLKDMTPEQRTALFNKMNVIGRSVGIHFKGGGNIGPTQDAHRLIYNAQNHALRDHQSSTKINHLVERIFEAYHELELDISDRDVLQKIAIETGFSEEEVHRWIYTDEGANEVDLEAQRNKHTLGSGVPVYIIQDEHKVDGSGDVSEFLEIFAKIKGVSASDEY